MEIKALERIRKSIEEQKNELLGNQKIVDEEAELSADDLMDQTDLSAREHERSMHLRLRNRDALLLRKIDLALERISDGTYGVCTNCEEDISTFRLEARPITELCITCKHEEERHEAGSVGGRVRSKSLGKLMTEYLWPEPQLA